MSFESLRAAILAALVGCVGTVAAAETRPDALLIVDMHREAIVERTVAAWPVAQSVERTEALRSRLWGLRADRLLAVSLSPGVDGLLAALDAAGHEDVAAVSSRSSAKALGDPAADLVYSPLTPCRIVDTRNAVGALVANTPRTLLAYHASSFAAQGGTATSCGIPNGVAALAMNVYAVNPSNLGFIKLWASNQAEPAVSTVNYEPPTVAVATGAIVPVHAGDNNRFVAKSPAGVHLVVDVVGYFRSVTAPGAGLRIDRHPTIDTVNSINGSSANGVTAGVRGATIAGGGVPAGDTDPELPGEGPNRVTDSYSTIGGGYANRAGDDAGTTLDASFATVAGGMGNVASGNASSVGGGESNWAVQDSATIAGGLANVASGYGSAIGGGGANVASNSWSTVAGGNANVASAGFAFAAGFQAQADQEGCFVFANWSALGGGSCLGVQRVARFMLDHGFSVDYFSRRADGGGNRWVYIGDVFAGRTINTWSGAHLTDAGVWVNASSSAASKTEFAPVDAEAVLERVVAMPVTTWRYREGEAGVRHIGPMAEDFHAAFGVGYGPHTIADLDARGVAFAAIQGLHQRMRERDAEVAALKRRGALQQRELAQLRGVIEAVLSRVSLHDVLPMSQ